MSPSEYFEFAEWVWSVERTISDAITDCSPRAWNEDHISYTWLRALRRTKQYVGIRSWPRPFSIAWDAFKAEGSLEESNGDVAMLVKQTFPNRSELVGVAFLEAKRVYDSGRYEKLDWKQLNRQNANSSAHKLLLYDNDDVAVNISAFWPGFVPWPFPYPHPLWKDYVYILENYAGEFTTHACVCPSAHALAYRTRTRALHELCVPLSHQICLRYFLGYDLDYDAQLVSDVSAGVAGGVDYLIVAHVQFGAEGEPSIDTVTFNHDAYVQEDHEQNL